MFLSFSLFSSLFPHHNFSFLNFSNHLCFPQKWNNKYITTLIPQKFMFHFFSSFYVRSWVFVQCASCTLTIHVLWSHLYYKIHIFNRYVFLGQSLLLSWVIPNLGEKIRFSIIYLVSSVLSCLPVTITSGSSSSTAVSISVDCPWHI